VFLMKGHLVMRQRCSSIIKGALVLPLIQTSLGLSGACSAILHPWCSVARMKAPLGMYVPGNFPSTSCFSPFEVRFRPKCEHSPRLRKQD
jgi:hypothetical protein